MRPRLRALAFLLLFLAFAILAIGSAGAPVFLALGLGTLAATLGAWLPATRASRALEIAGMGLAAVAYLGVVPLASFALAFGSVGTVLFEAAAVATTLGLALAAWRPAMDRAAARLFVGAGACFVANGLAARSFDVGYLPPATLTLLAGFALGGAARAQDGPRVAGDAPAADP